MVKFFVYLAIAVACFVGLIGAGVGTFLLTTPRPTNIRGCLTTELFKVKLCPKNSNYVRLRDISPYMKTAVIVSEDGAFYSHQGIDWFELRESINRNLEKGEYARGGSTITQQLAKNVYLTAEKSLFRKAREAIIAVQLEKTLSKDEILEKYLNVVEFGNNIFGVTDAAGYYFKKHPSQLSIAESAFLAFLLPSPKKYSVSHARKKLTPFARSQMRRIVERMQKFKKISEEEQTLALAEIDGFFGEPAVWPTAPAGEPTDEALPLPEEIVTEEDVI